MYEYQRRKPIICVISCFCLVVSKGVQFTWDDCFSHMSSLCCLKLRNKLSGYDLRSLIAKQHVLSWVLISHHVSINILIMFIFLPSFLICIYLVLEEASYHVLNHYKDPTSTSPRILLKINCLNNNTLRLNFIHTNKVKINMLEKINFKVVNEFCFYSCFCFVVFYWMDLKVYFLNEWIVLFPYMQYYYEFFSSFLSHK